MTKSISQWHPWGAHIDPNGDYTGLDPVYLRLQRIPPRIADLFAQELSDLYLVVWEQPTDKDCEGGNQYLEVAAFGSDGWSSEVSLAEWIDASLQGHLTPTWPRQNEDQISALKDLRDKIDTMIAKREAVSQQRVKFEMQYVPADAHSIRKNGD